MGRPSFFNAMAGYSFLKAVSMMSVCEPAIGRNAVAHCHFLDEAKMDIKILIILYYL
jgi:hypothetical protein